MALWRLAEDARVHLHATITDHAIACDLKPGMIHARHRPGGEAEDAAHIEHMARRYGYDGLSLIGTDDLASELGTDVYHGGLIDRGGGHLHPLNLALGLARAAISAGAVIHEQTRATAWRRAGGKIVVETASGRVTCDQLILSGDGSLHRMAGRARARVMPINNFILTTEPLGDLASKIIRSDAAVADSRFVVNYFRKTPDGRLLFGGGENYRPGFPSDIAGFVRRHMLKVYPRLADVKISHAWGGTLGITMNRVPFVGEVAPGVRVASGYSGQGVMLAPMSASCWPTRRWARRRVWNFCRACRRRRFQAGGCCVAADGGGVELVRDAGSAVRTPSGPPGHLPQGEDFRAQRPSRCFPFGGLSQSDWGAS
jgi:gamma-glutamylputrescine oxidase